MYVCTNSSFLSFVRFCSIIVFERSFSYSINACSGAIGNFIDRVRFGYVRDFIYFKLINFPVFNVADCYVTISVAIFIVLILFVYKENEFDFLSFKKKADKDNG